MTIHADLQAHINRSRNHQDRDVAIEELTTATDRIRTALGFEPPVGSPDGDETPDELLNEARTCIRNDDLVGAYIRMSQAVAAGGGAPPRVADKPIAKMTKAELHAYAASRGYAVSQANGKGALLGIIRDLDAEAEAAATSVTNE